MARGIGVAQGVNAFATGAMQGLALMDQIDARKTRAEDRALALEDRQRALQEKDEEKAREKEALFFVEQLTRARGGLDVDTEGLRKRGINPAKHFDSEKLSQWAQAAEGALSGQVPPNSPQFIEAFNWRFEDRIKKGLGEALSTDQVAEDGTPIPAGAKIVDKQVMGFTGARGDPESVVAGLRVTAQLPDGTMKTYRAPMTAGRSSDPKAAVAALPLRQLIQTAQGDILLADAYRSPEFQKELEARLAGITGKMPQAPKVDKREWEEGDQKVTEFLDESGNVVRRATAPRWNAKEPRQPRAPTDVEEYQNLVKQHGQEKADELWSRIKSRNGRGDLPLSPNQILANAAKARRAAQTYVDNFTKSSVDEISADQRKQMLDETYDEELAALGLDRMAVADAAQRTGKSDPARGAKPKSEAPAQAVREGATATNPKTGAKIIFRNGKWEPVNG